MRFLFHLWLLALVFALSGCAGSVDWRTYQRGRAAAEQDIAKGAFTTWSTGCCLPVAEAAEFHELMRQRYGIEFRYHPCRDTRKRAIWRKGYNDVSHRFIESRWGTNVWAATREEARRLHASNSER